MIEKKSNIKKQVILGHFFTMLCGGLIYLAFREGHLKMFDWFEKISLMEELNFFRNSTLKYSFYLPDWVVYSLPDGLWLFSYVSLVMAFWKNKIQINSLFWILFLPIWALAHEIGQFFHLVQGTFDFVDVVFYIVAILLPFILYSNSITIKNLENEHNS